MDKTFWSIFWAAVGAVMLNIIGNLLTEPVQDQLGILGQFLAWRWASAITFGIIALAALIPIVYRRARQKPASATGGGYDHRRLTEAAVECSREHITPEQQYRLNSWPEDRRLANIYQTLVSYDYEQWADLHLVKNVPPDWSESGNETGAAFLYFQWDILRASVYTVHFDKAPDGLVKFKPEGYPSQGKMSQPMDWGRLEKPCISHRCQWVRIRLAQYLVPEVVNAIQGAVGRTITFDFSDVTLVASTQTRDGKDGPQVKIWLPKEYKCDGPPIWPPSPE